MYIYLFVFLFLLMIICILRVTYVYVPVHFYAECIHIHLLTGVRFSFLFMLTCRYIRASTSQKCRDVSAYCVAVCLCVRVVMAHMD